MFFFNYTYTRVPLIKVLGLRIHRIKQIAILIDMALLLALHVTILATDRVGHWMALVVHMATEGLDRTPFGTVLFAPLGLRLRLRGFRGKLGVGTAGEAQDRLFIGRHSK